MKNKVCTACGQAKLAQEFRQNYKSKDGRLNTCNECLRTKAAKKPSMRTAINEKCKECIYDPLSGGGTWKQQVEACTSPGCPLFLLRPTSEGEKNVNPKT